MIRAQFLCAAALTALMAAGAVAQDAPPQAPPPGDRPAAGPDAVKQFDSDGDGQLTGEELGRARAFVQSLRRALAGSLGEGRPARDGDQPRAPREGDRARGPRERGVRPPQGPGAPEGPRGPEGRRPLRPRAAEGDGDRPTPPQDGEPLRMFDKFDADSNGSLSREEFQGLMGALRERRGPGGPPEGPRFAPGAAGPPGPAAGGPERPREGRGEGRGAGRRGGPRPPGPQPRGDDGGPAFEGPPGPPPPRAEGDDSQGPRPPRIRPRDGARRRPPREVGAELEGPADDSTAEFSPRPELDEQAYDAVF